MGSGQKEKGEREAFDSLEEREKKKKGTGIETMDGGDDDDG